MAISGALWVAAGAGWGRAQFYERLEGSLAGQKGTEQTQLHWRCVRGQPPANVASDERRAALGLP